MMFYVNYNLQSVLVFTEVAVTFVEHNASAAVHKYGRAGNASCHRACKVEEHFYDFLGLCREADDGPHIRHTGARKHGPGATHTHLTS